MKLLSQSCGVPLAIWDHTSENTAP